MLGRLRRSFERERRFVADASHELRTPVAVIKTELEGALRAGGHDPQVRAALVAAVEECDHLAQLAEDLLVLARSEEGGLPVRPEPVRGARALTGVRDRFIDRAGEQGRDDPSAGRIEGVSIDADPLRMRQALGNFVDNALRYGEGEIALASARCPAAPSSCSWQTRARASPPRLQRTRLRALRARRRRPHPRRHRPRARDRARRSPRPTAARAEIVTGGRGRCGSSLPERNAASGESQRADLRCRSTVQRTRGGTR